MTQKTSAHYQREFRRRLREQGLVKKEVWIRPENARLLTQAEKTLREPNLVETIKEGEFVMTNLHEISELWTSQSLKTALEQEPLFSTNQATIELIDGIDASLFIEMKAFGDLPVFLTVVGEQIIVESVLWPVDAVSDVAGFNDAVLRTHKYFPLSTISLDTMANGESVYHMFGALSASSIMSNVLLEIDMLANNVIQATQAYAEFLIEQPTPELA
ncbi:MAG: YjfI family protein [Oleispira antarctica]|nr:YjfI family protein [Oleispira antarctica]MBQ0791759.1 YjfI family protein [Oleispira antarctica]